jgi:hypothetical protein
MLRLRWRTLDQETRMLDQLPDQQKIFGQVCPTLGEASMQLTGKNTLT